MELDINNEKISIEKDGKMVECDVLFTFDSESTLKSYIGYTDHSIAPNGRKNIFVSAYNSITNKLENITDDKELEMVQDVLQRLDEEASE